MSSTSVVFPREGQGFRADVRIGSEHLVLMAVHTTVGPVAAVYNATLKKWQPEREWADDIEDAKRKAESRARKRHSAVGLREPFPAVEWQQTG